MCVYLSEVCGVATRETHLVLLFLIRSAKDCGGFGPQYNDPEQVTRVRIFSQLNLTRILNLKQTLGNTRQSTASGEEKHCQP